ncbi:MAG: ABC transporter substrate-binding protein [Anaerolineae bacterium]
MMRYWKLIALVAAACAGLLLTACGGTVEAQQQDEKPLTIGVNAWPGYGVVEIASKMGFFEQAGAPVTVKFFDSVNETNRSFAEKRLDAATMVLTDTISQSAAGVPLDVIWTTDISAGADVLVASPSITKPEDLRGKRIGVSYGSFGHVFLSRLLSNLNMSLDDVTVVNVAPEEIPAALSNNIIDAGHTFPPFSDSALQNGAKVLLTSADAPSAIIDVLAFQDAIVENRPNDVQAVVKALDLASAWWAANQTEGNAIVAEFLSVAPDTMPDVMSGLQVYSLADNKLIANIQSDQSIYRNAQYGIDLFKSLSLFKEAPDLQHIINPSFVENAGQ